MSFLNKYKTDKRAEVEGVWVEIDNGVSFRIARLNNDKAREMRRTLEKPYRNFQTIPDSKSEEILRKIVANAVLLDWKGMTDEAGVPISYSPEAVERILKEYPDLLNDVVMLSAARETFQAESIEAVKND